jgi:hypothetical protein
VSGAGSYQLTVLADAVLPFAGRETGLEVGGLSGLAFDPRAGIWIGVSDDRRSPRWFELGVRWSPGRLQIDVGRAILAETSAVNLAVPAVLDFESVGLLSDGTLLIGSEGDIQGGTRHRHSLVRYSRDGRFLGEVPLPDYYHGDPEGTPPGGLRDNLGLESLAMSPDGLRVWLAAENPLAQDDEPPGIERSARTRLLELVVDGATLVPGRELVYEIAPSGRAPVLGSGQRLVDQGVVALLWVGETELLSMERAFLRDDETGRGANLVRIFHVRLNGADEVSGVASLHDATHARPVEKTLILDLSEAASRLRPSLAPLDNFEAMAWGPLLPDGTRTLLIAADDNFSRSQQNAFVLLGVR